MKENGEFQFRKYKKYINKNNSENKIKITQKIQK